MAPKVFFSSKALPLDEALFFLRRPCEKICPHEGII